VILKLLFRGISCNHVSVKVRGTEEIPVGICTIFTPVNSLFIQRFLQCSPSLKLPFLVWCKFAFKIYTVNIGSGAVAFFPQRFLNLFQYERVFKAGIKSVKSCPCLMAVMAMAPVQRGKETV